MKSKKYNGTSAQACVYYFKKKYNKNKFLHSANQNMSFSLYIYISA